MPDNPVHCPAQYFGWLAPSLTLPVIPSQNRIIDTLLIKLEIKLSLMALDIGYVLPALHLFHIQYRCSLKTDCIDTMFTVGANSTTSKRAQFQHPCQSTHTYSSDNLLLDFEGVFTMFPLMLLTCSDGQDFMHVVVRPWMHTCSDKVPHAPTSCHAERFQQKRGCVNLTWYCTLLAHQSHAVAQCIPSQVTAGVLWR